MITFENKQIGKILIITVADDDNDDDDDDDDDDDSPMSLLLYACIFEYMLILYLLYCLLNKAPVETKEK